MITAILVAAGSGKRFGGNKLFQEIGGRPLIFYALKQCQEHNNVEAITVVAAKNDIETVEKLASGGGLTKVLKVVEGGVRRQDSVHNALKVPVRTKTVLVHDAARPLISQGLIDGGIAAMSIEGARGAVPVVPVIDTIKSVSGRFVEKTVSRKGLFCVQTPQFFDYEILQDCHEKAIEEGIESTDDASLLENYGYRVATFEGNRNNIKVTYKEDFDMVRYFLKDV